jgi:P-type E1-E2 ATPase
MPLRHEIPGTTPIELEHLVLDVNGTLTDRGQLIAGVTERIERLRDQIGIHLLSADTRGLAGELARQLAIPVERIASGEDKSAFLERIGSARCAAIGNGLNDAAMLRAARLGIAVVGPEGASPTTLNAADVVCPSIGAALGLLLDPLSLASTLRP